MPSVDVSIVTWNSAAVLERLLQDLVAQSCVPARITVVDNGSSDESRDIARRYPEVEVIALAENTGFAHAHNIGIAAGSSDYVFVVNPDVRLDPKYLETLVTFAEQVGDAGSFVGTVQRPDGAIDTTGLMVSRTRIVRDRQNAFTHPTAIFGVSGAVALYRRRALDAVKNSGQVFHEALFAYKEDVELAWRLQWAGWGAFCVPHARAVHEREVRVETKRSRRSQRRRFLSYRNHLLLFALVETPGTFWPEAWAILPAELGRFAYLTCTDPRTTFRALAAAVKMWHAARMFAAHDSRRNRSAKMRTILHV